MIVTQVRTPATASSELRGVLEENEHLKAMYKATLERAKRAERLLEVRERGGRREPGIAKGEQAVSWAIARFVSNA